MLTSLMMMALWFIPRMACPWWAPCAMRWRWWTVLAAKIGNGLLQSPKCFIDATKLLPHRRLQSEVGGLRDIGIRVEASWITLWLVVVERIPILFRTRTCEISVPSHLKGKQVKYGKCASLTQLYLSWSYWSKWIAEVYGLSQGGSSRFKRNQKQPTHTHFMVENWVWNVARQNQPNQRKVCCST